MTALPRRAALPLIAVGLALPVLPRPAAARSEADDRRAVVEMVEAAARTLAEHGFPAALSHSAPGTWARPALGLYVFVIDRRGTLLLHPDARMEGHNVLASHDAEGKPFIRAIIDAAAAHPEGAWTSYLWPSVVSGGLGTKRTYAKAVGDLVVCAGYVATDV